MKEKWEKKIERQAGQKLSDLKNKERSDLGEKDRKISLTGAV